MPWKNETFFGKLNNRDVVFKKNTLADEIFNRILGNTGNDEEHSALKKIQELCDIFDSCRVEWNYLLGSLFVTDHTLNKE